MPAKTGVKSENAGIVGEAKAEFRKQLITALVAGLIAGIVAAGVTAWTAIQNLPAWAGIVPAGAVAYFDLEGGCPAGWTNFEPGWGRFIIGAATKDQLQNKLPARYLKDGRGADLSERIFGSTGGEEKHLLTIGEMPSHDHSAGNYKYLLQIDGVNTVQHSDQLGANQPNLDNGAPLQLQGSNEPHNNIPPYVALLACKKL